jgi:hypothetical protein
MLQVSCEECRGNRFHGNDIRFREEGLVDSSCLRLSRQSSMYVVCLWGIRRLESHETGTVSGSRTRQGNKTDVTVNVRIYRHIMEDLLKLQKTRIIFIHEEWVQT